MQGSWDSIQKRFDEIYSGKKMVHLGTIRKRREGGAFLDGINVYDVGDFWHYISLGMSELYEKESKTKEVSGWGYEYSFKLKKHDEVEPPIWVVTPLQKLARYVFNQKTPFGEAHFVPFGSAVMPEINEKLNSLIFSFDPALKEIYTPTGALGILEVLFITQKDIDYCFSNESASIKLIDVIRKMNFNFVNDFSRSINYCDHI